MKCFYHNDLDGECSAAIVKKHWEGRSELKEFIPMDYSKDVDFKNIKEHEEIVIVDFSFSENDMNKLINITENVIWIDHHKTAIDKLSDFSYLKGIRGEGGKGKPAACKLTWDYFFNNLITPMAVLYISDYDSWTYKIDTTREFKLGMDTENTNPLSFTWEDLFNSPDKENSIIDTGLIIDEYRKKQYSHIMASNGFTVEFEGFKGVACNAGPGINSELFETAPPHDIMLPFYFNGEKFTVSIYSTNENIDCSEIAKKHGGGGHKGAAGFVCKSLPFIK